MTGQPAWAAGFISWMHPAAVALAVGLPLLRAGIRAIRRDNPLFAIQSVIHDVMSGFALPSFVALCLAGWVPKLVYSADSHALQLAGALGIIYTIAEIWKAGPKAKSGLFY